MSLAKEASKNTVKRQLLERNMVSDKDRRGIRFVRDRFFPRADDDLPPLKERLTYFKGARTKALADKESYIDRMAPMKGDPRIKELASKDYANKLYKTHVLTKGWKK